MIPLDKFIENHATLPIFSIVEDIVKAYTENTIVTVCGGEVSGKSIFIPLVLAQALYAGGDTSPVYVLKRTGYLCRKISDHVRGHLSYEDRDSVLHNIGVVTEVSKPTVIYTTAKELAISGQLHNVQNVIFDDAHDLGAEELVMMDTFFDDPEKRMMFMSSFMDTMDGLINSYIAPEEGDWIEFYPESTTEPSARFKMVSSDDTTVVDEVMKIILATPDTHVGVLTFEMSPTAARATRQNLISRLAAEQINDASVGIYSRSSGTPVFPKASGKRVDILIITEAFTDIHGCDWLTHAVIPDTYREPVVRNSVLFNKSIPLDKIMVRRLLAWMSPQYVVDVVIVSDQNIPLTQLLERQVTRPIKDIHQLAFVSARANVNPATITIPYGVDVQDRELREAVTDLLSAGVLMGTLGDAVVNPVCSYPGVTLSVNHAIALKCAHDELSPDDALLLTPLLVALSLSEIRGDTYSPIRYNHPVPSDHIARAAILHHLTIVHKNGDSRNYDVALEHLNIANAAVLRYQDILRRLQGDLPEHVNQFWERIYHEGYPTTVTREQDCAVMLILFRVYASRCYRMGPITSIGESVVAPTEVNGVRYTDVPTAERSLVAGKYGRTSMVCIAGNLKLLEPVLKKHFVILDDLTVFTQATVDMLTPFVGDGAFYRITHTKPNRKAFSSEKARNVVSRFIK